MGGQKTLRTYWKNYFEKTDTLVWVVDATDRERIDDCGVELRGLLVQEVCSCHVQLNYLQRLLTLTAAHGCLPPSVQEQERRSGMYERKRYT